MDVELYEPRGSEVAHPVPDHVGALVAGWLLAQRSTETKDAYRRDINAWLTFLARLHEDPLQAVRKHADAWATWMAETPTSRGRPAAVATINRRLASVSSFYDYLVSVDEIEVNRVRAAKRHKIDKQFSPTFRPSEKQAKAIMRVARDDGARSWALVTVLVFSGARVSEVMNAEWDDLVWDGEVRVLEVVRKGGTPMYLPLRPVALVGGALDGYRAYRARLANVEPEAITGAVFLDRHGRAMTRQAAANIVSAIGSRAGCPRLTPHSLRHAFATLATLAGVKKDDLQKWMGHRSSETTERYINRVQEYESHPGQKIADLLGL